MNAGFHRSDAYPQDLSDFILLELLDSKQDKTNSHLVGKRCDGLIDGLSELWGRMVRRDCHIRVLGQLRASFSDDVIAGIEEYPEKIGAESGASFVVMNSSMKFEKGFLDSILRVLLPA
jgi:hypothetical protein